MTATCRSRPMHQPEDSVALRGVPQSRSQWLCLVAYPVGAAAYGYLSVLYPTTLQNPEVLLFLYSLGDFDMHECQLADG